MEDRLKELKEIGKDNPWTFDVEEDIADEKFAKIELFFSKADKIRSSTEDMRLKVMELREIYEDSLGSVVPKNKRKQGKEIEDLVDKTNATATNIRDLLQALGKEIPHDEDALMTTDRIKKNVHTTLLEDFLDLMQDYQGIQNKHNGIMRRLVREQVEMVNPKATDEDVEKAIENPQIIFASESTARAQESFKYIQNKHTEILKLEKSLEEVHQLFVDMALLVEEQSETISRIAYQVSNVKKDITSATENLREANKIQRKRCVVQ